MEFTHSFNTHFLLVSDTLYLPTLTFSISSCVCVCVCAGTLRRRYFEATSVGGAFIYVEVSGFVKLPPASVGGCP